MSPLEHVERAREWAKTPDGVRLTRYFGVSVITTLFSIGGLALFFGVLQIGTATECNVLVTAIATIPSYYLNRIWAWGKTGRSHLMKEVVPFWVIAFLSLVLSTIVVRAAAHEAHHITQSHSIVTLVVVLANLLTYTILWVAKFVFFNKVLFVHRHPLGGEAELDNSVSSESTNVEAFAPLESR